MFLPHLCNGYPGQPIRDICRVSSVITLQHITLTLHSSPLLLAPKCYQLLLVVTRCLTQLTDINCNPILAKPGLDFATITAILYKL